jgi:hypothetical protein
MAQTKLKISLITLILAFSFAQHSLESETSHKGSISSLSLLYDTLSDFPNVNTSKRNYFRNQRSKYIPFQESSGCSLEKTGSVESIHYYGVRCDGSLREGLIFFSKNSLNSKSAKGYFKILGTERIGKKNFIKIAMNLDNSISEIKPSYTNDTDFNYDRKVTKKNKVTKPYTIAPTNANLTYFRTIAFDKNRRQEAPSGLEIFFDHTCPLKFVEVDESFYWDNTISYIFEISCIKNTPYALVRVPGNKQNKLVASNHVAKTPEKGDSFLARLKLRKLTNEQAYWEDFKIYYE